VFDPTFTRACSQALVIGVFGGAGLVLVQLYSRRGPLIYPAYAAILVALTLSLARAGSLPFSARALAAFTALAASTVIAMAGAAVRAAGARRDYATAGRVLASGGAPWWAPSLILTLLVTASAGVAYVSM
jgi:hypothetical protein